jgi:hypothetical protein
LRFEPLGLPPLKNWGKNPDMKDNQGKFQPNSSNFKNENVQIAIF